ncbi:MAG TPA: Gfo/Idh/MocA family oxidoreductase, partial [Tepidisphaeraceae bacterium]|nr:Gfo/Idh/MocA family oxidoreductase [Tepidisphaeraceae bacterium]
MIPVAVIGCGRMGRLHARAYAAMPEAHLEWVYDSDPANSTAAAHDYGCKVAPSIEQLVDKVKAVSIAVPTIHHVSAAEPFLRKGVACIIEKPLAPDSVSAKKLVELAKKHNAPLMVGHIERFNPAVRALLDLKLKPQFIEVQR